jgi:adenine-specific DNA-methyltransferase
MTSLAEKEGLKGQVQTIYVDPPYGTRFGYNWQCAEQRWMAAR